MRHCEDAMCPHLYSLALVSTDLSDTMAELPISVLSSVSVDCLVELATSHFKLSQRVGRSSVLLANFGIYNHMPRTGRAGTCTEGQRVLREVRGTVRQSDH